MYESLINKKVKVVLKLEVAPNRPYIYEGEILTEGEDYIRMMDKYGKEHIISKDQIATVSEILP